MESTNNLPRFQDYRLALLQLNSTPDIDENLAIAEGYIRNAADRGAALIGLPECTPFLGPEELLLKKIAEIEDKFFSLMRRLSEELSVAIFAGGYRRTFADSSAKSSHSTETAPAPFEAPKNSKKKEKAYNCLFYVDAPNKTEFIYDKVHLFDVSIPDGVSYEESQYIEAGRNLCPLLRNTLFGNLGFSICYDLRFPEMYRRLSCAGAEALLVPAAFTAYTGRAHWHTLIRARAIENLSYVFAPAQTGLHFGKRRSFGHSLVIDPWGEVLGELEDKTGILFAEIQAAPLNEARQRLPVLKDQKHLQGRP